MNRMVGMKDEGWAIIYSLANTTQNMNQTAGTRVYISLLLAYTSVPFSSCISHNASILNSLDITCLAQNTASHSKTQPITYTNLYIPSVMVSATCNCIIMLMPRMLIHFQLTETAPKGSRKEKR
jgi:hypothetical protein